MQAHRPKGDSVTAAEARAIAAPYADRIKAIVDGAPPIPAAARDLLVATGFRAARKSDDLKAAS